MCDVTMEFTGDTAILNIYGNMVNRLLAGVDKLNCCNGLEPFFIAAKNNTKKENKEDLKQVGDTWEFHIQSFKQFRTLGETSAFFTRGGHFKTEGTNHWSSSAPT